MEKIKRMYYFGLILIPALVFHPCVLGQNSLSKEQEKKIKVSNDYYFGEGTDFNLDIARQNALIDLTNQLINSKILQTKKAGEIFKIMETRAHISKLEQKGKIKMMAWIAKDSVIITNSFQSNNAIKSEPKTTVIEEKKVTQPVIKKELSEPIKQDTVSMIDPILKELSVCKTYNEVMRVARLHGLVVGRNSSIRFEQHDKCIVAVFNSSGALSALLDKGNNLRTDLLSGKTIQNPEQNYKRQEGYSLLWMLNNNK